MSRCINHVYTPIVTAERQLVQSDGQRGWTSGIGRASGKSPWSVCVWPSWPTVCIESVLMDNVCRSSAIVRRCSSSHLFCHPCSTTCIFLIGLQITNRSFRYASPHLWNQLSPLFRQPHPVHSPPSSPHLAHITSSQFLSTLSPSVTSSAFHSRLQILSSIVFLQGFICVYGFWTRTVLPGHWRLFVLVSFFYIFWLRLLSYHIVRFSVNNNPSIVSYCMVQDERVTSSLLPPSVCDIEHRWPSLSDLALTTIALFIADNSIRMQ